MIERDAIELIQKTAVEASAVELHTIEGVTFSPRALYEVHPVEPPRPTTLTVSTLSALVAYVTANVDEIDEDFIAHVVGPHRVDVLGPLTDHYRTRPTFISAKCGATAFKFGAWLDHETFAISMRRFFHGSEPMPGVDISDQPDDLSRLLMLTGAIDGQEIRASADDGFSQEVTTRQAVSLTDRVKVANPFELQPFDTFADVDEPAAGSFLFRVRQGPSLMLEEINPAAREKENIGRVAEYLKEKLPPEVLVLA